MSPCLRCGACCATYRVGFYRGEAIPGPGAVPEALVVDVGPFRVAMAGTERQPPRCVALEGTVGEAVRCGIHPLRPSACRDFGASYEAGVHELRCDEARARHGLAPLRPEDWELPRPRPRRRVA